VRPTARSAERAPPPPPPPECASLSRPATEPRHSRRRAAGSTERRVGRAIARPVERPECHVARRGRRGVRNGAHDVSRPSQPRRTKRHLPA
jgi:hypothetical protein